MFYINKLIHKVEFCVSSFLEGKNNSDEDGAEHVELVEQGCN